MPDEDAQGSTEYAPGIPMRPVSTLNKRSADRILYALGNERAHAFLLPLISTIGGTVFLHDWVLFDLMAAAEPALERGGLLGHYAAWKCGGLRQRSIWAEARKSGNPAPDRHLHGQFLMGWHEPESGGRWIARRAGILAPQGVRSIQVELDLRAGQTARLIELGEVLDTVTADAEDTVHLSCAPKLRELVIEVDRSHFAEGDSRELGAFVRRITWAKHEDLGETSVETDLGSPSALAVDGGTLSDCRFDLSFHRPVVRYGDNFLVHSTELAERIEDDRGAPTTIGIVPHGVDPALTAGDRDAARGRLGWTRGGTLAVSFGAIQDHKRPGPLLDGLALARSRGADLHLVLAGAPATERFDLLGRIDQLGLEDHVTITGYLEEEAFQDWLSAADLCVNLRGPSSGGTSGGAARALAAGRALVLSDLPEWREFPDDAVRRISLGEAEVEELAAAFQALVDDPGARSEHESAARAWAVEVASWSLVGARVHDWLAAAAPHRTARRSLIRSLVAAEERRREQRSTEPEGSKSDPNVTDSDA